MIFRTFILSLILGLTLLSPGITNVSLSKDKPSVIHKKEQIVYVTRTGKKYHREDCRYLRRSSIPMKLSAARKVYDPCSVCQPPK
jgi:hypothetical protein